MRHLIPACVGPGLAILLFTSLASAHGCHQGWQDDVPQGWHRHGSRCEPRQGLRISDRTKPRVKRRGRASGPGQPVPGDVPT